MKKVFVIFICAMFMAVSFAGSSIQQTAAADTKDIGIVSISATEANNARYIQGVIDAAAEFGWTVTVTDCDGSVDDANAAITNLVTRGVDYIIDMVFPVTSLNTGLLNAKEANIPVATWGGGFGDGVWMANGSGGPHAIPVVNKMVEDITGKGDILALTYHTGQVCREREEEMDKILTSYSNINVTKNEVDIPGYIQDGMDYTNAWIASRPEGDTNYAIWGCWDDPALGAMAALKQMDRKDVHIYGENGNADAIQAIKEGWMTATIWQDSYAEGKAAIAEFVLMLDLGDAYEKGFKEIPGIVVTSENVDTFMQEHPEAIANIE